MSKENWDYAIDMFGKSVVLDPSSLLFRQTLRGVECKKYRNNKTGARMAGLKMVKVKGRIKKARLKENWEAIDKAAEDGLKINPWDPQLNADMAEACRGLGYPEAAVFGYRKAIEGQPGNAEFSRKLALLLELRGEYMDAVKCWERVHQIDPHDAEARSKITGLQALDTAQRGGYEGATSTRDVLTAYDYDRPADGILPEAVDGPGVSLEADLQRAIRKDESNKNNYLKLADLYRREKRLEEAAQMLTIALQVSGGDQNIREQLEDVQLDQLRQNLALAKDNAKTHPEHQQAKENTISLAKELLRREIEVLSSRVEHYPQDSRVKFELARLFMRIKKWEQAIPLLQRAVADTRLEGDVLVRLGKCFIAVKNEKLARRQFELAVQKIDSHDRPELCTEAYYLLGRLCEDAGQRDPAENHYNEVLSIDYGYKDARERLERLQSGDSEPG